MVSPSEQTLLITGANGFLGGRMVKEALDRGYHVRGTARSESSAKRVQPLFAEYGDKFTTAIVPDISKPELYEAAFAGTSKPITGVINVAAPFSFKVEDVARDLLDPAINGAIGVLDATKRFGKNVTRVVSTSSFASIIDLSQGYRAGYTYTEADWNPMTYEEASKADAVSAYCASKTLAEKATWEWEEREKPSFTLSAICPPWIFGTHLGGIHDLKHLNESTELIWKLLGAEKIPAIDFGGFADVQTVAAAHISAFETPEAAGQRFLVGTHFDYQSAADAIREQIPETRSRIPEGTPGSGWSAEVYEMDGSKAKDMLGIEYKSLRDSMRETMGELLEAEAAA